jgi:phosphoserine phosphatase RsbU/P
MHRLLHRQLRRSLGVAAPEDLPALIEAELAAAGELPPTLRRVLEGFATFVERVDTTYEQADRDLELRTRSLDLSSAELSAANERLRADLVARNRATASLRNIVADLAGGDASGDADAEVEDIEGLSRLVHGLVAEREQQRRQLDNLKFALDEHAIVSMTDAAGAITYANDQFCNISGYRREELVGQNHRMVSSRRHGRTFFADMWRTITSGKVWHGEICNLDKSRREYWVAATIVPLLDGDDRPKEYIAIRTDITRQKEVEQRLAQYQKHLETLVAQHQEAKTELELARARELSIGAQIQRSLLISDIPPEVGLMSIAAHTEPSAGIDGDFYEFLSYAPDLFDISIGDVMGKGVPAALIGVAVKQEMTQVIATSTRGTGAGRSLPEPAQLINLLHEKLTPRLIDLESFVTLAYLRFDLRESRVTFVDAGHPHVILVGQEGLRLLSGDNLPLGISASEEYRQYTTRIAPGDLLFLYSDGVSEARNAAGEEFGVERLCELLRDLHTRVLPAEMILQVVRKTLRAFEGQQQLADDRTCVALRLEHAAHTTGPVRTLSIPRRLDALAALRTEIGAVAQEAAFDEVAADALTLAGFEAATNVIRHTPQSLADETLHCRLAADAESLALSIDYLGEPFVPPELAPDFSGESEGGFGLYIIAQSVDEAIYESPAPGVCRITLRKRRAAA